MPYFLFIDMFFYSIFKSDSRVFVEKLLNIRKDGKQVFNLRKPSMGFK
ncbi:MAG: hypothetical protein ACTSXU_16330 [Promethearchaeota archaeon]